MSRPRLEVAEIFRRYGSGYREAHGAALSPARRRAMRAIELCRTAALGGHVEQCDRCGHRVISYNSCRNRHCPKCQCLDKARWLEKRRAELLPVEYFHVVFTLPECLAPLALQNQKLLYDLLFHAASQTLLRIAADPKRMGAQIGFVAVLHTWGQTLLHHPHLHCLVPGGGLSPDGSRWISARRKFFLPVRVLSRLFRGLFLEGLRRAFEQGKLKFHGTLKDLSQPRVFAESLRKCRHSEWVVYAKPPFGSPEKVLDYLARYSHRVAISNDRLVKLENGTVSFRWKDYRNNNARRIMALQAGEFIRRFLLHILPDSFMRIRYYGFFCNRLRRKSLEQCLQLLSVPPPADRHDPSSDNVSELYKRLTGQDAMRCPLCHEGRLVLFELLKPEPETNCRRRAPPRRDSS